MSGARGAHSPAVRVNSASSGASSSHSQAPVTTGTVNQMGGGGSNNSYRSPVITTAASGLSTSGYQLSPSVQYPLPLSQVRTVSSPHASSVVLTILGSLVCVGAGSVCVFMSE